MAAFLIGQPTAAARELVELAATRLRRDLRRAARSAATAALLMVLAEAATPATSSPVPSSGKRADAVDETLVDNVPLR
jgi:hypothetical protein